MAETKAQTGAQWIWTSAGEDGVNLYADFRQTFALSALPSAARLQISADAQYEVYLNGTVLPLSQFPDYPEYKVMDEAEISAYLRVGENVLCVRVNCPNEDNSVYRRGRPGVFFRITAGDAVPASSGEGTLCRVSRDYVSGEVERISPQLGFSFRYDATGDDGWLNTDYQPTADGGWGKAVCTGYQPALAPRPILLPEILSLTPVRVWSQGLFADTVQERLCGERMRTAALAFRQPAALGFSARELPAAEGITLTASEDYGDGIYVVLDMHAETFGYLHLDFAVPEDTDVLIGFGEHLDDLRVRTAVGGRQLAASYRAKAGRQTFTHRLKRIAGRYLQLHIYARSVTLYAAGLLPVRYPVKRLPQERLPDELHQRIFEVGCRTLELCMHEHYTDCPWREQALYAMDTRNQMLCGYPVFDRRTYLPYAQASLRLLALGLRSDGLLELCAPARVPITIPVFSLCFVTAVAESYDYGGGEAFAREMLPTVHTILRTFVSRQRDGLVPGFSGAAYWNFYEWREGLNGYLFPPDRSDTMDAPLNALLILALRDAARLCMALDDPHAAEYTADAAALTAATARFWEPEVGLYRTRLQPEEPYYSALTQVLLILADAVPDDRAVGILDRIIRNDPALQPATLACHGYLYDALMRYPSRYADAVLRDIAEKWGAMLYSGATSFWETSVGADDFDQAGSLCHGWSAIPVYVYCRYRDALFGSSRE